MYVKISIGMVLVGFGVMFMFFNLSNSIMNFLSWFRYRELWLMEASMMQFIGIEKIDKGEIYVWKTKRPCQKK